MTAAETLGQSLSGEYEVLGEIGSGGMALVYEVRNVAADRIEALKIPKPGLADDESFLARFVEEARKTIQLTESVRLDTVNVYHVVDRDGLTFFTMERLRGETVGERLRRQGHLSVADAVRVAIEVCGALGNAHDHGMVHRDVKPGNVMLCDDGRVVVMDFGIARAAAESQVHTRTGTAIGSPHYMSPEQGRGQPVDGRSDIYSLGVMLYTMVTGEVPFKGETTDSIIYQHVREAPVGPRFTNAEVPEWLESVILKALAKAPEDRFQLAGEFAEVLGSEAVVEVVERAHVEPGGTVAVGVPRGGHVASGGSGLARWLLPFAIALIVAGGAGIWGYGAYRDRLAEDAEVARVRHATMVRVETAEERSERVSRNLRSGIGALGNGEYADAIELLNVVLEDDPAHAQASQMLKEAYEKERARLDRLHKEVADLVTRALRAFAEERVAEAETLAKRALVLQADQAEAMSLLRRIEEQREEQDQIARERREQVLVEKQRREEADRMQREAEEKAEIWREKEAARLAAATAEQLEKERRRFLSEVETLLSRQQYAAALVELEDSAGDYQDDDGVNALLAQARRGQEAARELEWVDENMARARLPGGALIELVYVEPGSFYMGSRQEEKGRNPDEGPRRKVEISQGYFLGKYEVTESQWASVMGTGDVDSERPVASKTWDEVATFILQVNQQQGDSAFRLPTEAEWEFACRAGSEYPWSFGNDERMLYEYSWYSGGSGGAVPRKVGQKLPNRWGLYDMHGNIQELCQDWYGPYTYSPDGSHLDPQGPQSGKQRVVRGGGITSPALATRSASRWAVATGVNSNYIGFRLVRRARQVDLAESAPRARRAEFKSLVDAHFALLEALRYDGVYASEAKKTDDGTAYFTYYRFYPDGWVVRSSDTSEPALMRGEWLSKGKEHAPEMRVFMETRSYKIFPDGTTEFPQLNYNVANMNGPEWDEFISEHSRLIGATSRDLIAEYSRGGYTGRHVFTFDGEFLIATTDKQTIDRCRFIQKDDLASW